MSPVISTVENKVCFQGAGFIMSEEIVTGFAEVLLFAFADIVIYTYNVHTEPLMFVRAYERFIVHALISERSLDNKTERWSLRTAFDQINTTEIISHSAIKRGCCVCVCLFMCV